MNEDSTDKNDKAIPADQAVEEDAATETETRRRLQDGITSKTPTRKMNLDRRVLNDRRGKYDTDYKGPSRRFTIDRRLTNKDRRKPD